jgi:hypothetical protein
MLHKVPFFTNLDNRSKCMICAKLRMLQFAPYDELEQQSEAGRSLDTDVRASHITTEGRCTGRGRATLGRMTHA